MQLTPDEKVKADIEKFGWHVVKVAEDKEGPGFCYTIGFHRTLNHPEVIIIGLPGNSAHQILNHIGSLIEAGNRYESGNFYADILDGYQCYMLAAPIEAYPGHLGMAIQFYQEEYFPVLQFIFPNHDHIFPWQKEWPEAWKHVQPILGHIDQK